MNKTKRNILDTALELLNEHGVAKVAQRTISEKLKISPGNLTYHYKKKTDIIETIYFELVEKMNVIFESSENGINSFQEFIKNIEALVELFYQYRFFFIDIVQLLRDNKVISNHYQKLQEIRKNQFKGILAQLLAQNIIRPEELPNEYDALYNRIQITFDFYLSFVGSNTINKEENHIQEQKKSFLYTVYPYLTKAGKEFFSNLVL